MKTVSCLYNARDWYLTIVMAAAAAAPAAAPDNRQRHLSQHTQQQNTRPNRVPKLVCVVFMSSGPAADTALPSSLVSVD